MGTAETLAFLSMFICIAVLVGVFFQQRKAIQDLMNTTHPPSEPAEAPSPPVLDTDALLKRIAIAQDVTVTRLDTIIKLNKQNLAAVMGTGTLGLDVIEERDAEIREQAEQLVAQYKISWEEALQRAKSIQAYRRAV